MKPASVFIRLQALPAGSWQKTAAFPDWKGYPDNTLAMNSTLSFRFFHGQGSLWLKIAPEVESFTLYVNQEKMDTSSLTPGLWSLDFSAAAVDGVNTLQLSGIQPLGLKDAVEVYIPYPVVLEGDGSLEGIRPESLRLISDLISSDLAHGFTSAQLAVVRNGRLVAERAWGRLNSYTPSGAPRMDSAPVTVDTLYDLASVTKMLTANYAVQKLVTDGLLEPDTPIVSVLGDRFAADTLDLACAGGDPADLETQRAWKRSLTVRDLMRHQAGFPASPPYNDPDYDLPRQAPGAPGSNPCYARTRQDTLLAICKTPLLYAPGSRTLYSDVDYMLLGFIVEAVSGLRLDQYLKRNFWEPLGLTRVTFLPLENGFQPEDCAATELCGNTRDGQVFFPGVRTATLQGQVHDERAWYCMEGISGHAGLFGCARDLARLASAMLTGGYGFTRLFSRDVLDTFTAPKALGAGQWGLGWWRQGDDQRVCYFGSQAAPDAIGHQGWTGTLFMVDPSRNLVVVYLTNKINSPILKEEGVNAFSGSRYTAASLGFVPQLLSVGLDSGRDVSAQLLDLLADMAAESLKLIPEHAYSSHPAVRNVCSKLAVLRSWADALSSPACLSLADSLAARLPL